MTIKTSKDGYIKAIKKHNKRINEVIVNKRVYRFNPVYKTYNSIIHNGLLHENDIIINITERITRS